jgi:hypothetical protein
MQNMQSNMQNMQNLRIENQYAKYALPTLLMLSYIDRDRESRVTTVTCQRRGGRRQGPENPAGTECAPPPQYSK